MAVKYFRGDKRDKVIAACLTQQATLLNELKAKYATVLTLCNELKADHNGLATKLDADAGVTDTNYNALQGTTSANLAAITSPDADTVKVVW
jgi:hypothetical protein